MLSYNLYLYESKTSIITDSKNWDHYCLICHFCGFCITIALLSTVCVSREVGLSSCPIPHSAKNDKWQCVSVCEQACQLKFLQCIWALGIYALRFIREPIKSYMKKNNSSWPYQHARPTWPLRLIKRIIKKIDAGRPALFTLSCVVLLSNLADCLCVTWWLWGSGTLSSLRKRSFLNCSVQEKIKVLDNCFGTSKKKASFPIPIERCEGAELECHRTRRLWRKGGNRRHTISNQHSCL